VKLDPVAVLEQRLEFLTDVNDLATECNWSPSSRQELHDYLLEEVIKIDTFK